MGQERICGRREAASEKRTENGLYGHPAGNTFALVSSKCRSLNDEACCCVITRYGPIPRFSKQNTINP